MKILKSNFYSTLPKDNMWVKYHESISYTDSASDERS